MTCDIIQIPVLKDNYSYLLRDSESGTTAVIDPAQAAPVMAVVERHGGRLDYILNTHHHHDHTGGNHELKRRYGARILVGELDRGHTPDVDEGLSHNQTIAIGKLPCQVLLTPGHTKGHVVYWFTQNDALFSGDTLFSLGCGALFEGTAEQMWQSLQKIRALPDNTRVYCAHEYTEDFVNFALSLEPDHAGLLNKKRAVTAQRARGISTIPSQLAEEKALNPFLRADDPKLCAVLGKEKSPAATVLAHIINLESRF